MKLKINVFVYIPVSLKLLDAAQLKLNKYEITIQCIRIHYN